MSVRKQVDSFMADTVLMGQRDYVLREYKHTLNLLVDYCHRHRIDTLEKFEGGDIKVFLEECKVNDVWLAKKYQQRLITLFRYLKRIQEVTHELNKITIRITEKKTRKYFDSAVLKLIREHLKRRADIALFDVLMETGVHCLSIVRTKKEDVNWNTGSIVVRDRQGQATHTIFVSKELLNELYEISKKSKEYVFTMNGVRFNRNRLFYILQKIGKKLSIKINYHGLRSSFAMVFYKRTNDLMALSNILGHKNIKTTEKHVDKLYYKVANTSEEYIQKYKRKDIKYVSTEDF